VIPAKTKSSEEKVDVSSLEQMNKEELVAVSRELKLEKEGSYDTLRREEVLRNILKFYSNNQGLTATGILEVMADSGGFGFLRHDAAHISVGDVYVSQSQIRRFALRTGDMVYGEVRPPKKDGERYFSLVRVDTVNENRADQARARDAFDRLIPVFPDEHIQLETESDKLTARMIDLFSPIGRGQRGLIVSPPKAVKTTVLKDIAKGLAENHKDINLMVVLIGERPEEVTDMRRSVSGEVFSSTFDESVEDQCRVADLALERAKRQVESGKDVLLLLDSITRLARAYNLAVPSSGRTLSGGIDPAALYPSKRFFGAARNVEHAGSLTIIATCLVDTGSRMDEVIYEEFKGTGNQELHLERKLAEKRVFPAIDIQRSGTRREEMLYSAEILKQIVLLRRMVALINSNSATENEASERVLDRLSNSKNNAEFLAKLYKEGKA